MHILASLNTFKILVVGRGHNFLCMNLGHLKEQMVRCKSIYNVKNEWLLVVAYGQINVDIAKSK